NQTPESTIALVDDIEAGRPIKSTRGPEQVPTFKDISRLLAGFEDGLVDEGPSAGPASLRGLEIAKEKGWVAPEATGTAPQVEEGN
ncbi:NADH-quinone oxidoreductase subunit E, partial [Gleimia europaea]|nr:NADH-quinone oxidoreductase subunit E [Gleimia europaea]